MKIFISIASYQDPLLKATVNSAFNNADKPENLVFGICDQSNFPLDLEEFSFSSQIRFEHVDPKISEGPCWARKRVQQFFTNEDYYFQIDSHMQFEQGWDSYFKNYIEKIKNVGTAYHQKPIITCYPRAFEVIDAENEIFKLDSQEKRALTLVLKEDSIFIKRCFSNQIAGITENEISHGYLIAAGCLFTTKEFVNEIPYDDKLYFYGEELAILLRAFTRGFSVFHTANVPVYHLYHVVGDLKRKLHWDEDEERERKIKWIDREKESIDRLVSIVDKSLRGTFGMGKKRTLDDFKYISGIDLENEKIIDMKKATTSEFLDTFSWDQEPFKSKLTLKDIMNKIFKFGE